MKASKYQFKYLKAKKEIWKGKLCLYKNKHRTGVEKSAQYMYNDHSKTWYKYTYKTSREFLNCNMMNSFKISEYQTYTNKHF